MLITDRHIFFLKEWPSQWKMADIMINGTKYNCCEQYMMYQKALTFGDLETAILIMQATTPQKQKELGRKVLNYDEAIWASIRYNVVLTANLAKFMQHPDLCGKLLNTGQREFVEANPRDPIWGIGMAEDDPDLMDESRWGQNLLGKVLTEVKRNITISISGIIY